MLIVVFAEKKAHSYKMQQMNIELNFLAFFITLACNSIQMYGYT